MLYPNNFRVANILPKKQEQCSSSQEHTSPRESKADIRNSIAPKRLRKTGIIASSL